MSSIHIRRAARVDAPVIAQLVREFAAEQKQEDHVSANEESWRRMLSRDDVAVLLAELGEQPAGYVSSIRQIHLWSGTDVLSLDDLYVRPHFRDRGVGRALMCAIAATASADRLVIRWGVETSNHAAQRFYRRLGAKLRTKIVATWTAHAYAP